jgi:hypothetical protein
MSEDLAMDAWLQAPYAPAALYLPDSDCIEYVAEDTTYVHRRIDEALTLIFDETAIGLIGFKLKGVRNFFERIKGDLDLHEGHFVELCSVLQRFYLELGEKHIGDARRRDAYRAAEKLAEKNRVKFDYRLAA